MHLLPHRPFGRQDILQQGVYTLADLLQSLHTQRHSYTARRAHHIRQNGEVAIGILKEECLTATLALGHAVGNFSYFEA